MKMSHSVRQHLFNPSTWLRGFFMLIFIFVYLVARPVLWAIIFFQFVSTLLSGKVNERLLDLGMSLSTYHYQIITFLTYNTEEKPYPFSPWPVE